MSLLEELKVARSSLISPHRCTVCQWVESQDPDIQEPLAMYIQEWIRDGLSREKLLYICQQHGLNAQSTTFKKHIRECVLRGASVDPR